MHDSREKLEDIVDVGAGIVRRAAFVSDEVFLCEQKQIFNRLWIFVAHETEIQNAGDYVVRTLGDAQVIVVRSTTGAIEGLLNSCAHRGVQLCRTRQGNKKRFVCPYHGWSFEHSGRLLDTSFANLMPSDMDKGKWGLLKVPRMESHKGFIFASWNEDVEPLDQYLGDYRFYFDSFFARTSKGSTVLATPHRVRIMANWKVGALNFLGDGQHIQTTHAGPLTLDPVRAANKGLAIRSPESVQVIVNGMHGCNLNYLAPGLTQEHYNTHPIDLKPLYRQSLSEDQVRLLENLRVGVGTIFPNLSFIETQVGRGAKALLIRQWVPISAHEMEMISWTLAEEEATTEYKSDILAKGLHNFGVAGVFEQDDMQLWESSHSASRSTISRNVPYSFLSALPFILQPLESYYGPGVAYTQTLAEMSQLHFMETWQSLLIGGSPAERRSDG